MNVLDATRTPRVMNLREVIQAFLDHRRVVLQRRSRQRLGKIVDRMEILAGYMIAFLNISSGVWLLNKLKKYATLTVLKQTSASAAQLSQMRLISK